MNGTLLCRYFQDLALFGVGRSLKGDEVELVLLIESEALLGEDHCIRLALVSVHHQPRVSAIADDIRHTSAIRAEAETLSWAVFIQDPPNLVERL